jgi:hypothetical protein
MVYEIKSISINKSQSEWIRKNHISLSKLVQDIIEKEMKK